MKSFRTEFEQESEIGRALVEKDIIDLEQKIRDFHSGELDDERFRTLRLARGVYGQRQTGVQMIRIKIPYGKLNGKQLERICDVSEEYSTGKLHITTRQDIQIHYVELDRTPELWAELEKDEITLREACGNTVRNVTASALSGIDPEEEFDVRPYADAVFRYFLRNPICQEMGRKIKISFSNNVADTALSFMHDLGFVAKYRLGEKGFKLVVAGGLGSQSRQADVLFDFLPIEKIIPVTEAVLRLFERNGERTNRMKARLKFWVREIGIEAFKAELNNELKSVEKGNIPIENFEFDIQVPLIDDEIHIQDIEEKQFIEWRNINIIQQKQEGLFAIGVKVRLGDFTTIQARKIAEFVTLYTGDELTLTIDQNLVIRHVQEKQLARFFYLLKALDLVDVGYGKSTDITACPGTDTCNLGIANSTALSNVLEEVLTLEYPKYRDQSIISIKISGCMNACGQHMIANLGFQGMSIRTKDKRVVPAIQVLLGGGNLGDGKGRFADKVIKIPSKRAIEALRLVLDEFETSERDSFLNFYDSKGEKYFYDLLKPLGDLESLKDTDFIDWGQDELYKKEIGIGECAGVVIDLVSTLFKETEVKLDLSKEAIEKNSFGDSIYHSYSAIVNTAKAMLTSEGKRTNSHTAIINQFDEEFVQSGKLKFDFLFKTTALKMRNEKPSKEVAEKLIKDAQSFYGVTIAKRILQTEN
ncbi:MAG: HEPN domain-containing protein [Crocinitomicaceae bacterium]|nr:HEPN domain-containing protein [Crocinitomicaceae bacterium]